jgi:twitching motility protein PilT
MHTTDARETISRIVDLFPMGRQRQARFSVASTLSAVVCQRLVPRADGFGRVPTVEVLVVNGRVVDLILDPTRTEQVSEVIREGGFYGMQSFDQSLLELVRNGLVTIDEAQLAASNRHDFMLALAEAQLTRSRA